MSEFRGSSAVAEPEKILVAAIGSLGDLHPVLAMALELKRRGHAVTVASSEFYRGKIETLGLGFHPLRPNWDPTDHELIAQCEDIRTGPEVLVRKMVLPHLRDTCEDLMAAAADADFMISVELVLAAPLVAEKLKLRWASAILSPCSFLSAYDPSLLANAPEAYRLRRAGRLVNQAILEMGKLSIRHWWQPVRELRRDLGLRIECEPIFRDKFSPDLVLALFSSALAKPQPDWPRQTVQPGFIFYDDHGRELPELADFLAQGEPPIVFTLGSAAVHNPGNFFEVSLTTAQQLGRRALLLGSKTMQGMVAEGILALPYAPYSQVFPRAAAVVHQGGSGTTGQALRAGRPQLVVPYGWDQPDNGARVERLGAGLSCARTEYSPLTAGVALRRLLSDGRFAAKAAEAGSQILREDGLGEACDAVERVAAGQSRRFPASLTA
jgi:UDP:flavonoid glycosyltransferase YjiC (YdhE family)